MTGVAEERRGEERSGPDRTGQQSRAEPGERRVDRGKKNSAGAPSDSWALLQPVSNNSASALHRSHTHHPSVTIVCA